MLRKGLEHNQALHDVEVVRDPARDGVHQLSDAGRAVKDDHDQHFHDLLHQLGPLICLDFGDIWTEMWRFHGRAPTPLEKNLEVVCLLNWNASRQQGLDHTVAIELVHAGHVRPSGQVRVGLEVLPELGHERNVIARSGVEESELADVLGGALVSK